MVLRAALILVVAATQRELAIVEGVDTLCCGIGPVESGLVTAAALARRTPRVLLHVGVAGATSLDPPALVIGSEAVYCDLLEASARLTLVDRVAPDPGLLAAARRALPHAAVAPIGTSARVGGGTCEVEAMEGFAVLRAAELAGVRAIEVRAVSNRVAEGDRGAWRIDDALDALAAALPGLMEELGRA